MQILSIGSAPDSIIRIAAGQQYGPRWAPSMFSSLSSPMIDQSTVTSLPKTQYTAYVRPRPLDRPYRWRYFIHGWSQVIAEVFDVAMEPALVARLAEAAESVR